MVVVGIRTRDQVWQLMLVGGVASLLLVLTGVFVLTRDGGDSSTSASAGGLSSVDADLSSRLVAGPSTDDDDGDAGQRSSGLVGVDGDTEGDGPGAGADEGAGENDGDDDAATTLEVTTTSAADSTTTTSTEPESTTSEAVPTSSSTTTVAEVTTSSAVSTTPTSAPTSVPEITAPTSSTSRPGPSTSKPVIITLPTTPPEHSITAKDLAKARERWASMGYDSYSMTVRRLCFCLAAGSFEVIVRSGEVVSVSPLEGQRGTVEGINARSFSVPGLFSTIENGLDAARLHVVFNNQTGVPTVIEIDQLEFAVDDEISIYVSNFQPHRG